MLNRFSVALGAGAAAALLFAVSAQNSLLAVALAYLAPLPIMIATLGWGLDSGAVAVGVACAVLAALTEPMSALLFGLTIAAPAWLVAAFAVAPIGRFFGGSDGQPLFAPLGAIVTMAALLGVLVSAGALAVMMAVYGGYAEAAAQVASELERAFAEAFQAAAPEGMTLSQFTTIIVRHAPPAVSISTLLMLCVNLYAAGRSTALSNRLARPWPDIPRSLIVPWPVGLAALLSCLGAYALPAPADQFAWIGVAALGGAFVLHGLSLAHDLSRGLPLRPAMLIGLYLCCVLRSYWTLPLVAALGLLDSFVKLRQRAAKHFPDLRP